MRPRFTESHPRVEATRGQVAIERGPLVYCCEACDQDPGTDLSTVVVDVGQPVSTRWRDDRAGGATRLEARGRAARRARGGTLYAPVAGSRASGHRDVKLVALPYFLWANRRRGWMRVWLPRIRDGQAS
jgi:DUF1680 family protein